MTGLGLVCPLGKSVPTALAKAIRGERAIRAYESSWGPPALRSRVGGTVEAFDGDGILEPRFADKQEPATLFALAAAREALAQAGADIDRDRFGCVIGAGLGGSELWHRALTTGVTRMAAVSITGTAVTGLAAIRHQLRGPSLGIANACASGTSAILAAADQIRLGRADAMLVGACESSMRGLVSYASFVDAGMNPTTDPAFACTPFSANRRGFVLAEGAGMLVLERLDHARARGAHVLATLAGGALANDAYHVISPDPTGEAWARVIRLALADADVSPDEVDVVSAHATATPQGDVAETRAIRRALGAHADRVLVSATKSMHGHAFGAAGAIETVLALGAMQQNIALPTIDLAVADPECDLDYVATGARKKSVRILVKNGFGAGGVSSALVFRRDEMPSTFEQQFAF